jgi:hypothetical protein
LREWDESDWVTFNLNEDGITIENRAGRTHPGTEQRPMCSRLMLRMMSGMFGRLRLRQSTDRENAEYE